MKIIVMSDSHSDVWTFKDIVDKHSTDADLFIFLGDGESDYDTVKELYPHKRFEAVRGNCDFGSFLPDNGAVTVCGKKILFTHGYVQNVKFGTERLEEWARENGADIVLYGHTHTAKSEWKDGLYVINPGSLCNRGGTRASYAVIEIIKDSGVLVNIVNIN